MTATFTLTGRVLDKSKRPVKMTALPLVSNVPMLSDGDANEVYTKLPAVMTDNDGYLCRVVNGGPDDDPGVALVLGPQYTLRGTNQAVLPTLVFSGAQAVDGVLNIADIAPEPPDTPPTYADLMASLLAEIDALTLRIAALEAGGGGGFIPPAAQQDGTYSLGGLGAPNPDGTYPTGPLLAASDGTYLIGA